MGSGIVGPPNVYNAGLDFDYSVWTPGTRVDLVNVSWNNDYRDVVKFPDRNSLNGYIDSRAPAGITVEQLTYAKPGEDVYLGIPYNRVNRYNYLRASNPLMPIPGDVQRDFYYFILECEYIAPNTTRLRLQLDVWQTYVYDITFGNCYVERGHIGIANSKQFDAFGRDYLTVPEGLDIGSEYQIVKGVAEPYMNLTPSGCDILAVSTVDLTANPGTVSNPVLVSAPGSMFQMMPSGAAFYHWNSVVDFTQYLNSAKNTPWVTQGIMAIYVIPNIQEYHPAFSPNTESEPKPIGAGAAGPPSVVTANKWQNWRDSFLNLLPAKYRKLKKLATSPYLMIEVTAYAGNSLVIKPEMWNNADAIFEKRASFFPPDQRVVLTPKDYGKFGNDPASPSNTEFLNFSVQVTRFPSIPVVNNGQIGYLAANAHSIKYQGESADWSQQRALAMAQGQYDIATGAMHTAMSLSGIGVNADIGQTANTNRTLAAQAAVNAISSGVSGVGNALTPGGFGGAAISGLANGAATGINAGIQTQANDEALAIRNQQAAQSVQASNRQAGLSRDTNVDLARFAARGDYANALAGINAKVQDAQLIQPSSSGNFGGDTFNQIWQVGAFFIKWKFIDAANLRSVGDYWLRYGYSIHTFIKLPQTLMVMSKFTYWKLAETYISSANVPESHKQVVRGILEKGVTVWANPDDIGNIDIADNVALEGISY